MTIGIIKGQISELEEQAWALAKVFDLPEFLKFMASQLEMPYSLHKYNQSKEESVGERPIYNDGERHPRYFNTINGFFG